MEIALIFTPLLASLVASYLFGNVNQKDYKKAWFQPPGYIFMIVWTAIYIQLGFLLYESYKKDDWLVLGLVIGTICLTYLWIFFFNYKQDYKLAIYILFLTLVISLELYTALLENNYSAGYLYTYPPFIGWLIFALLMASNTIKNKK